MPTSAKAVRILAAAFSSLAVAGNLFLRGRAVDMFYPKTAAELTNYIRGVIAGEISVGRVAPGSGENAALSNRADTSAVSVEAVDARAQAANAVKWRGPSRPARVEYEITVTPEALELCKQGGHIMGIDDAGHHTLNWSEETGHFVIRSYPGRSRAESAPVAKSFEQLIAEIGDWEPPADGEAVKASEFDMGPEAYGQQLLRCLDQLRQHRSTQPSGFSLAFGNGAKLVCTRRDFDSSITARIDLPPGETLRDPEKMAAALKADGLPTLSEVIRPDSMEMVEYGEMFDRLDRAADLINSIELSKWSQKMRGWMGRLISTLERYREAPPRPNQATFDAEAVVMDDGPWRHWRLPTWRECAGDPEATRVWNAVHKPALEWQKTAEVGPPPLNNDESKRRPIWLYYGHSQRGTSVVTAEGFRQLAGEPPAYWCEVEPAPPKPPSVPTSNAELHNEFE